MAIDREAAFTASHPKRMEILRKLVERRKYAAELENELPVARKVIAFHLIVLEHHGLIKGEYALKAGNGRSFAVKYYNLTDSGRDLLNQLGAIIA
ncbi:MAG: putative transcriptional regulator [Candidatus Nitrosomirales archaeon]|jgi:predicted transcriptional regulator